MRLKVTALSAQIPCSLDATSKCLLALGKGDRDGGGKARGGHQLLLCIRKVVLPLVCEYCGVFLYGLCVLSL